MRQLPRWNECVRCARCSERLGVYAPAWSRGVRVVVLGTRATWKSQAAQTADRGAHRPVALLRERLGLDADECVGDALIACGAGDDISPDDVAACSRRFIDQEESGAAPKVIVFTTLRAAALAEAAGLLDARQWRPMGARNPLPVLVADAGDADVVSRVAAALRLASSAGTSSYRIGLGAHAIQLRQLLGLHKGHREVRLAPPTEDEPKPKDEGPKGPLTTKEVREHLEGLVEVTPTRSQGPWRFVVVRIKQDTAVQIAAFDTTLADVRTELPSSFVLKNVTTGEVRLYVSLPEFPDRMSYGQGALLVRAFLDAQRLRWVVARGPLSQTGERRSVLAEVASVPAEPVSLPFGVGWEQVGGAATVEDQLKAFLSWAQRRDVRDFQNAERVVEEHYSESSRWTPSKRRRLRAALLESEVALDGAVITDDWAASLGGGWSAVANDLTPGAARIAALGVRHDGARQRWMRALVGELADLVTRAEVEDLMTAWLRHHKHVDELFIVDPDAVERQMNLLIEDHYKKLRGVPVRFWRLIVARVDASWKRYIAGQGGATLCQNKYTARVTYDGVRKTAFFIAREFYKRRDRELRFACPAFERCTETNTARFVRTLLSEERDWLILTEDAVEGVRSRTFKLAYDLWPPRRGDSILFLPP